MSLIKDSPTVLFKDNVAYIAQIRGSYIKGDKTKPILRKFFYTHELQKNDDIDI